MNEISFKEGMAFCLGTWVQKEEEEGVEQEGMGLQWNSCITHKH